MQASPPTPRIGPHPALRLRDIAPWRYRAPSDTFAGRNGTLLTYSARGALQSILEAIGRKSDRRSVLMPAFHCTTVVDAVLQAGFVPRFYAINPEITVNYDDLHSKIDDDVAAILVIHYFGFPIPLQPILAERRHGSPWVVIEDWAHSFVRADTLSSAGGEGDFTLYSFYKLAPINVGGALRIDSESDWSSIQLHPPDGYETLRLVKDLTTQLVSGTRAAALLNAFNRWRHSHKTVAGELQNPAPLPGLSPHFEHVRMPWLAKVLLGTTDISEIVTRRRVNYECWAARLVEREGLGIWKRHLPTEVCPWGFPVLVDGRSSWDRRWHAAGVPLFTFGETLHPMIDGTDLKTREMASYLANTVLMLGVDRLLTVDQIDQAAKLMAAT